MTAHGLGWFGVVRLGLVQTALGAIVVLTTSTLNRVMVVELAMAAALPGALVAWHYAVQMLRPRFGYGGDGGGRRTPWILGGMATLAGGAALAAIATAWIASAPIAGIALAVVAFAAIGLGVGAAGTSLLALLASRVAPGRRAAAAAIVWMMMIAGFVITAGLAGALLEPFSMGRLIAVTCGVCAAALALAAIALRGVEARSAPTEAPAPAAPKPPFREALKAIWDENAARRFTVFVFASMLAYSAQDLILEPFAGLVFGMTPGQSTQLAGVQHGGVLLGMIAVALMAGRLGSLRAWTIGGCIASALGAGLLVAAAAIGPGWPLRESVFLLGFANGVFAIAAIGSMMALAGAGQASREGIRMGLWGAAQAIAFALGGLLGAAGVDLARLALSEVASAYGLIFAAQAVVFLASARLAARVGETERRPPIDGAMRPRSEFALN